MPKHSGIDLSRSGSTYPAYTALLVFRTHSAYVCAVTTPPYLTLRKEIGYQKKPTTQRRSSDIFRSQPGKPAKPKLLSDRKRCPKTFCTTSTARYWLVEYTAYTMAQIA